MAQQLIIIGRSGNAADILDIVDALNGRGESFLVKGILDDAAPAGSRFFGVPVLGPLREASRQDGLFSNAIGSDRSYRLRPAIVSSLGIVAERLATLVHPAASVSRGASLGRGVTVGAGVCVGRGVTIGADVWLGAGCVIGHDAQLADHAVIAPGAVVSGSVLVGAGCYIGAGAVLRPGVTVGEAALVGMGAVVTRSVAPGVVVAGNPARPLGPPRTS